MQRALRKLVVVSLAWLSLWPQPISQRDTPPILSRGTQPVDWTVLRTRLDEQARWYTWAASLPPPQAKKPATVRANYATGDSVWDRIAACESGGNWADNTGNSYYGGLQMNMAFWHSYGGDEYAERPDLASREQQITVAERARDSGRGYTPWPVCGQRA